VVKGNAAGWSAELFADDGEFPNSRLPLIVYRGALAPEDAAPEVLEELFKASGWPPAWRSSIFTYHHYHSTAHECLGIASGEARVMFGGPDGREFDVISGDVVVIPAGVAHRRLTSTADFLVVGAYPPGQDWDLLRGDPADRPRADENIAKVPMPITDPVGGNHGPLPGAWA
jgi:uncharacterized protein YjlB